MQLEMISLGRIGASTARRLMQAGHDCAVHDTRPDAVATLCGQGTAGAASLAESAMRHAFGGHLEKRAGETR